MPSHRRRAGSDATDLSGTTVQPEVTRSYQLEMLELSKRGNIIVAVCFMPTPCVCVYAVLMRAADGYGLGENSHVTTPSIRNLRRIDVLSSAKLRIQHELDKGRGLVSPLH